MTSSAPHHSIRPEPVRKVYLNGWYLQLLPQQAYSIRHTTNLPQMGFAFDQQCGFHSIASDRITSFETAPNSLAYIPTNCDVYSSSNEGGEYLIVQKRNSDIAPPTPDCQPEPARNIVNSLATRLAHRIRRLILTSPSADMLLLEQHLLDFSSLSTQLTTGRPQSRSALRGLDARALRALDELIESRLHDPSLSIGSLADSLQVSSGYFSRAFKAARGKSPHDYILDRRIREARTRIISTVSPLSDIAYATGFSSQAHMTSQFRSRLGLTPGRLKRIAKRRIPQHS